MDNLKIEKIVFESLVEVCKNAGVICEIKKDTPLIGSGRVLDSLGLVNLLVDIETAMLDENIEISLTSENAMSSKISPFRTIGSLCRFIENQINIANE
jgi:acyl carrier protein